jgi:transcription termination/antitermination protein NusA
LSGWDIDILTEDEESNRRQAEFTDRTQIFMKALDVDETIAQLLAAEGFTSIEDVMYVDVAEIAEIEGFDEEIATELSRRAQEFVDASNAELEAKRLELGISDDIVNLGAFTPAMIVALGEAGVKELDDLADLAGDELTNTEDGILREFDLKLENANEIIMAARAHWFEDDEADAETDGEIEGSEAEVPAS